MTDKKPNAGAGENPPPAGETIQQRIARQRALREARDGTAEQTKKAAKEFWLMNNEMKKFWPRGL